MSIDIAMKNSSSSMKSRGLEQCTVRTPPASLMIPLSLLFISSITEPPPYIENFSAWSKFVVNDVDLSLVNYVSPASTLFKML